MYPICRIHSIALGSLLIGLTVTVIAPATADGPKDNLPDNVRQIPPKGVEVSEADRKVLETGLATLRASIAEVKESLKSKPQLLELMPDVEIYEKAVASALDNDEFFDVKQIAAAKEMIKTALVRTALLKAGRNPAGEASGLVVRGYRSRIDGSVQPYGLVVPEGYLARAGIKYRLDFWWHGRDETLSEVKFIDQRQKSPGEFVPPNTFVLHPYGRYCNANKFAGEIDTLECLEHVRKHYPIDDTRITARGFSMGGAACWQFATHFPTLWTAAAPGAGFAETPEFLNNFQGEKVEPTWYERKLWHWYNATDYAGNLFNLPTVAYSGEIDKQKQAADVMARELMKEGITLTHIIGPKTAHSYHPEAKVEINRRINAILAKGRDSFPEQLRFTTYTLRYNECGWLRVDELEKHWKKSTLRAFCLGKNVCSIKAEGVTAFTVDLPAGSVLLGAEFSLKVGDFEWLAQRSSDGSLLAHFRMVGGKWQVMASAESPGLAKVHGLQGPIDDAFMSRFLMVEPTGKPWSAEIGTWAGTEMKHACTQWRKQFRGTAPLKSDTDITDDDIKNNNLILWGDPGSNAVLAKIADKLPIKWTSSGIVVGDKTYDGATHVPLMIYPNPLNPAKYVVINSGFTFREYDYLSNARQVPRLPDYAVIDTSTPPNSRLPGKVVRAGFFGEKWELLADDGK